MRLRDILYIIHKSHTDTSSIVGTVQPPFLWWSVVECGGVWWSVVGCGGVWWSVVGCGGVWWSVVECGGVWTQSSKLAN
jgi:hypothetical protein